MYGKGNPPEGDELADFRVIYEGEHKFLEQTITPPKTGQWRIERLLLTSERRESDSRMNGVAAFLALLCLNRSYVPGRLLSSCIIIPCRGTMNALKVVENSVSPGLNVELPVD